MEDHLPTSQLWQTDDTEAPDTVDHVPAEQLIQKEREPTPETEE